MFDCVPCSILSTSWSDIAYLAGRDPRGQRQPLEIARQFCQSAKKLRVNALIEGLNAPAMLDAAIGAGADFASGSAIMPLGDAPLGQSALTIGEIRGRSSTKKAVAQQETYEVP
jgi:EAL domain-containing protein (putative c-di-GMP-specific phosphodiesterase class I)